MNLLIVDDEIVALNALKKRVDWFSYGFKKIHCAQDAAAAREILKEEKIELVLCDVEMPEEDGISLITYIHETYPDTGCIMVTCHAEYDYLRRAMKSKAYDYILKPIDYEELNGLLKQYLEERKDREEKRQISQVVQRTEALHESEQHNIRNRIDLAKHYIEEHLHEKIYVSDLADMLHVNEQYFMKQFKSETGTSVVEYIAQRRILLATALLKNTDKPISFIANCVGCESNSYFTKLFKKYTDYTPKEYREKFHSN